MAARWKNKPFFIRLFNWEFWPFEVVQFPVFVYYFYLSFKARSFGFWAATNPGIEHGGMLGESKNDILKNVPDNLKPITCFIKRNTELAVVLKHIKEKALAYPIVAKPDRGERGWQVAVLDNEKDLTVYLNQIDADIILQDFIKLPQEYGILYYKMPGEKKGHIPSIVYKEYLSVTGDGESSVEDLILENPRAILQRSQLESRFGNLMKKVLSDKETWVLEPIGNHTRGTTFRNANHLVDDKLITTFDTLTAKFDGYYFVRYDLKCENEEALKAGKIKILEINGVGSEPAHIYDPKYSIFKAWKDLFKLWRVIYKIAIINHQAGAHFMTFKDIKKALKKLKEYKKHINKK